MKYNKLEYFKSENLAEKYFYMYNLHLNNENYLYNYKNKKTFSRST